MSRSRAALLGLLFLATTLPFVNRAYHLDEYIYLKIASNVPHNPLFPNDTPAIFFGLEAPNYGSHTHPPGWSYLLFVLKALAGSESEIPLHLMSLVFPAAAILLLMALSRNESASTDAFSAGALLLASPAFLVMSHTVMSDVPVLASGLLALVAFRRGHLKASAVLFFVSLFMSFTAVCFLPAFVMFCRQRRELAWPAASVVGLGLWVVANSLYFGHFTPVDTAGFYAGGLSWIRPFRNLQAFFVFLGAVAAFPGAALLALAHSPEAANRKRTAALAGGAALALLLNIDLPALGLLFAACGGVVCAAVLRTTYARWFAFSALFFIVVGDMINARYILLMLPPLLLALAPRRIHVAVIVTSLAWSVLVAEADYRFVDRYRQFAGDVRNIDLPKYAGAEAGLRYYLERAGARTLSSLSADVEPAGIVVRHAGLFRYELAREIETALSPLGTITLPAPFFLQTFNGAAGAGFHDSRVGRMPVAISAEDLDAIEIAQVNPLIRDLPAAKGAEAYLTQWTAEGSSRAVLIQEAGTTIEFPIQIPPDSEVDLLAMARCEGSAAVAAGGNTASIPCAERWVRVTGPISKLVLKVENGTVGWADFRIRTPGLDRVLSRYSLSQQ